MLEIVLGDVPGWTVSVAPTVERALQMLDSSELAAVITDLHLPGMDGLELVAHVRAHTRWAKIPILVISGDADPGTPERVRAAGASAFFAKPYSPLAMRHKLEELIDAR